MSATLFGVPLPSRCLCPQPAPARRRLEPGDWVVWRPDADEGVVCGTLPGQAVWIRWASTGAIEVYALCAGAMHFIEPIEVETVDETPF
jgi:hypothetical protein